MKLVLLLLVLLLVDAQGIRVEPGFKTHSRQSIHGEKSRLIEVEATGGGHNGVEDVVLCKDDEHCTSGGRSRKLITNNTPSTTTTTSKVNPIPKAQPTEHAPATKKNEEEKYFSVQVSPAVASSHGEASNAHYPDIIDIAGMDYSPARRKPPIHN